MKRTLVLSLCLLGAVVLAACKESNLKSDDFTITVEVDGERLVYRYDKRFSVGQFLDEIGVTLGEYDEVNPLLQTQVRDGMRITITRVVKRDECENGDLPYETERQFTQAPGLRRRTGRPDGRERRGSGLLPDYRKRWRANQS